MVSKFFKLLNRDIVSMNQAALVLAIFSFLSQICGLFRDRLLATLVGPSMALDTYYAAFRVPDFVYNSFGILFSVTVLIPFIAHYMEQEKTGEGKASLQKFLNSIFTVYVLGMTAVCAILLVAMPWITRLVAPGFTGVAHSTVVLYSRIMLLSPFLFGLSSLLSSFAQVQKKFLSFAIAPLFYNLGILLGIIVLRPLWGMVGVVVGVVCGALLYFLVQVPTLVSLGAIPRLQLSIDWQAIKKVIQASLPRTLGSSLTNITFIMITAIASLLSVGSISVFQFSYNIENTPLLIVGVSYAVAAFPAMSKFFAEGKKQEFTNVLYQATRSIFFLAVPASFLIIVLRAHVVRILLGAGVFSWNDTRLVAATVAVFSVSVVAQAMILLLVRAFYAIGNTRKPLLINIAALCVTASAAVLLLGAYNLSPLFRDFTGDLLRIDGVTGTSVVMLAAAFSVGQLFNAIILWNVFHRTFAKIHIAHDEMAEKNTTTLFRPLAHMVAAGIIAAAASYAMLLLLGPNVDQRSFVGIVWQAVGAGIVGSIAYAGVLLLCGNQDIVAFVQTAKSKFWKQSPVVQEQQDL